jgi:cytochrome P450
MGGIDGLADTIGLYTVDPVDTMSSVLQWAILYLAHFPQVQQRMRKLIEDVRAAL